jgi:hypothetical protein
MNIKADHRKMQNYVTPCSRKQIQLRWLSRWRTLKRPPVRSLQQPATATPKISLFLRLLWRNENSFKYSGRYFLLM